MIEISQLRFSYDADFTLSLDSLHLPDRGFVSLIGPNGSGKTTLLRILAGLNKEYAGKINFEGADIAKLSHEKMAAKVSYVPVYAKPDNPLTIRQLILSGAYRYGGDADISDVAELCGLTKMTEKSVYEISSGEMKRVLIARALVQKTPVIIMDEPFANLDPYYETRIMDLIREISREKLIVAAVHNVTIAAVLSDLVVGMKDGGLLFVSEETPDADSLQKLYGTDFIFIHNNPFPDYFDTKF